VFSERVGGRLCVNVKPKARRSLEGDRRVRERERVRSDAKCRGDVLPFEDRSEAEIEERGRLGGQDSSERLQKGRGRLRRSQTQPWPELGSKKPQEAKYGLW
jgi:hypothetical protein